MSWQKRLHGQRGVTVEFQLAVGGPGDAYLVTAIDAGMGNGWAFPPSVLSASV